MSDGVHLFDSLRLSHGTRAARRRCGTLALPQLEKLLARLAPVHTEAGDEFTLSMPHERALARLCGLPGDRWPHSLGRLAGGAGRPRSRRQGLGPHHAVPLDRGPESHRHEPSAGPAAGRARIAGCCWRRCSRSSSRTASRSNTTRPRSGWPRASCFAIWRRRRWTAWWAARSTSGCRARRKARTLRRLQQEMQMLLYTHAVNEERARGGLLPVNSFWASGTGALPAEHAAPRAARAGGDA